jgi:hypothetical protein
VARAWPLAEADELVAACWIPRRSLRVAASSNPALATAWVSSKLIARSSGARAAWEDGIEKVPFCRGRMVVSATPSSQLRGPFSAPDRGQANSRSVDSG